MSSHGVWDTLLCENSGRTRRGPPPAREDQCRCVPSTVRYCALRSRCPCIALARRVSGLELSYCRTGARPVVTAYAPQRFRGDKTIESPRSEWRSSLQFAGTVATGLSVCVQLSLHRMLIVVACCGSFQSDSSCFSAFWLTNHQRSPLRSPLRLQHALGLHPARSFRHLR